MELRSELAFSNFLFENLNKAQQKSLANYEIIWSLFIESDPRMIFEEDHDHINYVQKLYKKINTRELLNHYIKEYFLAGSGSSKEVDEKKSESSVKTYFVNKDGSTSLKPEKEPWEMKMEEDRKEFIKKYPNFEIFAKDLDIDYLLDLINQCWIKALKCNSDEQLENYKELVEHKKTVKKMFDELRATIKSNDNDDYPVYTNESSTSESYDEEPYYLDEIMDSHNHLKDGRTSEDCDLDSDDYWNQEGAFEEATDKDDNFY